MLLAMPVQFYNQYRKGLTAFAICSRDGHLQGYLWALTKEAAMNRAERYAGAGATADYATEEDYSPDNE